MKRVPSRLCTQPHHKFHGGPGRHRGCCNCWWYNNVERDDALECWGPPEEEQ